MTTPTVSCESCGMPIETGHYCPHCTDADGALQAFDERFARMVDWQARRTPEASREALERATAEYLSTMPAWRDDPRLAEVLARPTADRTRSTS